MNILSFHKYILCYAGSPCYLPEAMEGSSDFSLRSADILKALNLMP